MLIRNEHIFTGCTLGVWRIDESAGELLALFPEMLRARAAKHIEGMLSEKRITEWLSVRLMIFQLLNEEKIIHHHRNGQPFFTDQSYHISISHTTNYSAVLMHPTRKVGIDVELRSEKIGKISSKFVSPEEFVDESQELLHQTLIWSAKETMFKLIDESGIDFRNHLHIHKFIPRNKGIIAASETRTDKNRSFEIHYEVFPDYVLAWAVE